MKLKESIKLFYPAENISTFEHSSGFKSYFINYESCPVTSLYFIVPTLSNNNKGLPHTLEHLIFFGSERYPHRGHLDSLALKSGSTGTNAFTTEDHTGYYVSVATHQVNDIACCFLDHVLHPTLTSDSFTTEIYHVDGEANENGVVFCEMQAREHTEADLMDIQLRKCVFGDASTYYYEAGGNTKDIAMLSLGEIQEFHEKYYGKGNCFMFVCHGPDLDVEGLCGALDSVLDGGIASGSGYNLQQTPTLESIFNVGQEGAFSFESRTIEFPAAGDEQYGSIGYAWKGVDSNDLMTIVAMDILFRYLQETAGSPLFRKFIEISSPFANNIDYEQKPSVVTMISLIFSGVPLDYSSEDDDDVLMELDLFEDGVFYGLLKETIQQELETNFGKESEFEFKQGHAIKKALKRHRLKILEDMEDDPHESFVSWLIPDILRNGSEFKANNCRVSKVFETLDTLEAQCLEYWKLILQSLLENSVYEIKMIPSAKLAKQLEKEKKVGIEQRKVALGEKGLEKLKIELEKAKKENVVHEEKVQALLESSNVFLSDGKVTAVTQKLMLQNDSNYLERPFSLIQTVATITSFTHLKICFSLTNFPKDPSLFKGLMLLQELLFQSDVKNAWDAHSNQEILTYDRVSQKTSEILLSHDVSLSYSKSFGNSLLFTLSATCAEELFEEMCCWVIQVLLFTVFVPERVKNTANNLIGDYITEKKRDGADICAGDAMVHALEVGTPDYYRTVFVQENYLKGIVESEDISKELKDLEELREFIVESLELKAISTDDKVCIPGFVQIGIPVTKEKEAFHSVFLKQWDWLYGIYCSTSEHAPKKPKKEASPILHEPFPLHKNIVKHPFPKHIQIIPMEGITSCYLSQCVPCRISETWERNVNKLSDFVPLLFVLELMTRSEGVLFSHIRGAGLAYDVSLNLASKDYLSFDIYQSSNIVECQSVLRQIIQTMASTYKVEVSNSVEGPMSWSSVVNDFSISLAKSSMWFKHVEHKSTAYGIIDSAGRDLLRGFDTIQNYTKFFRQELEEISQEKLWNVFQRYVMPLLPKYATEGLMTIITAPKGDIADDIYKTLSESANSEFTVSLVELNDLLQ